MSKLTRAVQPHIVQESTVFKTIKPILSLQAVTDRHLSSRSWWPLQPYLYTHMATTEYYPHFFALFKCKILLNLF